MKCSICGSTNNQTLGDGTIICECGEILKRGTEGGTQRKEKTTEKNITTEKRNNGQNSGQKNRRGQK